MGDEAEQKMNKINSEQEKKWIKAIQKHKSRSAAEQLIGFYYDEMYRFAYRQTSSKEDAQDLTQNIFLAMLRAISSYDFRKASFRTWLYRLAVNKAVDLRRQNCRKSNISLDRLTIESFWADDFMQQLQDKMLLQQIEAYVSLLNVEAQTVFRLHLYAEKTFPEIAVILERTESAVKSQYYRLLEQIRKEFANRD